MSRLTLSDGRWLDVRPMWISDRQAVMDIYARMQDGKLTLDLAVELAAVLQPAVTATSWGGTAVEMTGQQLLDLMPQWSEVTENDAVDPPGAATSAMTSLPPAVRASRSRSQVLQSGSPS